MNEKLRGTKMPYECLALNFDTLMNDYVNLKQKLEKIEERCGKVDITFPEYKFAKIIEGILKK